MSRVGKLPILIPGEVEVDIDGLKIRVTGPKGEITKVFIGSISIFLEDNLLFVRPLMHSKKDSKKTRAMWGTARSIINNMVKGVKEGHKETFELIGVGYRALLQGEQYLNLSLAKSHNTKFEIPKKIKVNVPKPNQIILESVDKEELGQFGSIIKKQRPPEPYKGKGIRRMGEYVERKEGKKN